MKLWRVLVPLLSLTAVVLLTWWDLSRTQAGPGPLHPAHAGADGLVGGADCAGCHRDGAVSAAACGACHAAVLSQLDEGTGVHGSLGPERAARCADCHSDHHGDQLPLLPPHAFVRAGIDDVAGYDHRHVAFSLVGVHIGLACTACHPHADADEPPIGGGRFLGLSQRCGACHSDPHEGAYGDGCAGCHGQQRGGFAASPGLSHDRFPLRGPHGELDCAACHPAHGVRSIADERLAPQPLRHCADCHDDPHGGPVAASLRFEERADCARCHDGATPWRAARPDAAAHAALGHALPGPHAQAACASCHGVGVAAPRWGGEPPAATDCARCHEHPHRPALLAAAAQGPGCGGCHVGEHDSFGVGGMSAAAHAATGFPLHEPHAGVACDACHTGTGFEQRFANGRAPDDCRACHGDAHAGQFGGAADVPLRQCTNCHLPHTFRPHRFDRDAHRRVWPLEGGHDAVACSRCHAEVRAGVRRFVGTPKACDACHEDVHAGRFDRDGLPRLVEGRAGCARCHDAVGFRELAATFDHALWTGYALEGAHAGLRCDECHAQPIAASPPPGTACADCHDDPHLGQFDDERTHTTDCRRCHGQTAFDELRFDHARDSRFALDDVHQRVACARCHVAWPLEGGGEVVRYRPLGRACGDCHRPGGGR